MKTMTVIAGEYVFRWAGGPFIAVWKTDRENEPVPDDMIQLPDFMNRSKATRDDIAFLAEMWLRGRKS